GKRDEADVLRPPVWCAIGVDRAHAPHSRRVRALQRGAHAARVQGETLWRGSDPPGVSRFFLESICRIFCGVLLLRLPSLLSLPACSVLLPSTQLVLFRHHAESCREP